MAPGSCFAAPPWGCAAPASPSKQVEGSSFPPSQRCGAGNLLRASARNPKKPAGAERSAARVVAPDRSGASATAGVPRSTWARICKQFAGALRRCFLPAALAASRRTEARCLPLRPRSAPAGAAEPCPARAGAGERQGHESGPFGTPRRGTELSTEDVCVQS